jgi:hypothetical protein
MSSFRRFAIHRFHCIIIYHTALSLRKTDLGDIFHDCSVDPVHTETAQQHQFLELGQLVFVRHGELLSLRGVVVEPLKNESDKKNQ